MGWIEDYPSGAIQWQNEEEGKTTPITAEVLQRYENTIAELCQEVKTLRDSVSQTKHYSDRVGSAVGGGWIYFDSSSNGERFSLHGVSFWGDGSEAWGKMVSVPGRSANDWWLKTPFQVRPPKRAIEIGGAGYSLGPGDGLLRPGNYNNITVAIGTDGYVYFGGYESSPTSGASLAITLHLYGIRIADYE